MFLLFIYILCSIEIVTSMDAAEDSSASSSESGGTCEDLKPALKTLYLLTYTHTHTGDEAIPAVDPPVAPNVVTVEKPEFFDPEGASKNNRPIPLPVRLQNPYPDFSGKIADTFPSDPPFQGEPKQTDSSNNIPVITSSIKGQQPPARWMHTAAVLQNRVIVWGGIANSATVLNDLWLYSYQDAQWTELEKPMSPFVPSRPSNTGQDHSSFEMQTMGRPPTLPAPIPMRRFPGVPREAPPTTKFEPGAFFGLFS